MSDSRRITFTDGSHFDVPGHWKIDPAAIVGREERFSRLMVARSYGMDITLTPCCGASFKGCDGYIGCRACYADTDHISGGLPFGPVVWRADLPEEERVVM